MALVLTSEMVSQVIISIFRRSLGKLKWKFLSHAERWWTNQASRAMWKSSCKNTLQYLRRCCSPIGQNNTKDFSAQSGGSIGRVVWKWSGKSRFPGAFFALLVNLRCFVSLPALFPLAPANRPRVSEDDVVGASHRCREVTGSNPVEVLTFSGFYMQLLKLRS